MDDFVHGASQLLFLNGRSYLTRFSDELKVPRACYEPEWVGRLLYRRNTLDFITIPFLFGYGCKALCAIDFLPGLSFFG
jgi:hypothetical protein